MAIESPRARGGQRGPAEANVVQQHGPAVDERYVEQVVEEWHPAESNDRPGPASRAAGRRSPRAKIAGPSVINKYRSEGGYLVQFRNDGVVPERAPLIRTRAVGHQCSWCARMMKQAESDAPSWNSKRRRIGRSSRNKLPKP